MAVLDIGPVDNSKPSGNSFKPGSGRILDIDGPENDLNKSGLPTLQPGGNFPKDTGPTRAVKELPEISFSGILAGEDPAEVGKLAAALLVTPNPREAGKIISTMFPDIGITEDEQGNLIANNNSTGVRAVINKPGASAMDVLQVLGIGSAFTVPAAGATALGGGLTATTAMGAAGAGTLQTAIEKIQESLGGDPLDESEIALATIFGGGAELAIPLIQKMRATKLEKQAESAGQSLREVSEQIGEAKQAGQATGVDLFEAQQTRIPSEVERQAWVAQLPAGSATARKALLNQNKQVGDAVDDFLNQIAPEENVFTGAERFREASKRAVQNKVDIRKQKTSPIYRAAYENSDPVDVSPVLSLIDDTVPKFPKGGNTHTQLTKFRRQIKEAGGDLETLHNIKLEIDDALDSFGESSIGRTAKRTLRKVKESLLANMGDDYNAAREAFEAASPPVNKITQSIIGKIAEYDDTQLKNISRRLFDPSETATTVGDIKRARKVISDVDPDAWNDIVRVEIERRMGSVKPTQDPIQNIPGQLHRAIFGNNKQKEVLYAAVDGRIKENLQMLETALDRARLGRPGGSQTAIRQEMQKDFEGGLGFVIRRFFGAPGTTVGSAAGTALTGTTADAALDAKVRAAAKVLFDPDWTPKLKRVQELDTSSPAFARGMFQLLDEAIEADLKNLENDNGLATD